MQRQARFPRSSRTSHVSTRVVSSACRTSATSRSRRRSSSSGLADSCEQLGNRLSGGNSDGSSAWTSWYTRSDWARSSGDAYRDYADRFRTVARRRQSSAVRPETSIWPPSRCLGAWRSGLRPFRSSHTARNWPCRYARHVEFEACFGGQAHATKGELNLARCDHSITCTVKRPRSGCRPHPAGAPPRHRLCQRAIRSADHGAEGNPHCFGMLVPRTRAALYIRKQECERSIS